jgi:hypothetical protein
MVYSTSSRVVKKVDGTLGDRGSDYLAQARWLKITKKIGAGMAGIVWKIAVWAQVLFCQVNYEKLLEIDIIFICHNI